MAKSNGYMMLIELAGAVLASSKRGENNNFSVDFKKLGWSLAAIAGQKGLGQIGEWRLQRKVKSDLLAGRLTPDDVREGRLISNAKPGPRYGGGMVVGLIVGTVVYVLSLTSEQRANLFKQIDTFINWINDFTAELQGKPYSDDYESQDKK